MNAEKTVQTVRTVQKIASEVQGYDLVIGQSDAIKALMKCQQTADNKEIVM